MNAVLISTYDLGHQPFALASAAAWLLREGAEVRCNDLAVEALDRAAVAAADLIAIHLPMHMATRLAAELAPEIRALNRAAHICFFGLYAPLNAEFLRRIGGNSFIGGEFEGALAELYRRLAAGEEMAEAAEPVVCLDKQAFLAPARDGLPPLARYGTVTPNNAAPRTIGYTEASRGCKHLCRHCPVVPVYGGRFRIVQRDIVLEDVRRLAAAGAEHITFGDPDFFNGPGHALSIVRALHAAHPGLTFDVTIKVSHLLDHEDALAELAGTGCICITTAVESVEDEVLRILRKGHTRADFHRAVAIAGKAGIALAPTFIPFTPWTTPLGFLDLLRDIAELGLVPNVAPVQLALRLLVPPGSHLLSSDRLIPHLGVFDEEALGYRWTSVDPGADELFGQVRRAVEDGEAAGAGRAEIFQALWRLASQACGRPASPPPPSRHNAWPEAPVFSEAWYCCAEPAGRHYARV